MLKEELVDDINASYYDYCKSVNEFCDVTSSKSKWLQHYMREYVNDEILESNEYYSAQEAFRGLKLFKKGFKHNCEIIEENILKILNQSDIDGEVELLYQEIMDNKQKVLLNIEEAWINYGASARFEKQMCR